MPNATIDTAALDTFTSLYDHDWDVTIDLKTGWMRVCDTATAYLLEIDAETMAAVGAFNAAVEAATAEPERKADAYSDFCQATSACHADDAPANARAALCELGHLDEENLTWGW